jgi:hypothetical protein
VLGQGLPLQSLLLTKLDEASSPWPLLQFLSDNPLRIAGASHGARPSDLSLDFTLDQLVDLALAPLACTLETPLQGAGMAIENALTGAIGLGAIPDLQMADAADAALTASGAAPSQDPTDSAILPQAAGALSPTLASIAGLPAVPVFLSTAQVLGAAPAASKRRAAAQTEAHPQAAEIAPITVKSAARKKPARAAADEPAAPAVSSRKRKPAEAIVVPVAVNRSRRKASATSAHP